MYTADGNQINMALAVQKIIADSKEIWSGHKGFTIEVETMNKQLDLVRMHQQHAEAQTEGVTKDKANAAGRAIELGMELAGSAYVYAKKAKNETLKKQFKITKHSLANVQGVVALSRLNDLHDNMEAIISQLGDYVTKEELSNFKKAIDEFKSMVVAPRSAIVEREKSNNIVIKGVKELKSIFENMDNLISKFKGSEFEQKYKLARIVIDLGSRKRRKGSKDELKKEETKD